MTVIDHLSVGVPSIEAAADFYNGLMKTIGLQNLAQNARFAAYGADAPVFLIMTPADGKTATAGNGVHIAFVAPSRDAVDNFHRYAVEHRGDCAGQPGERPGYPKAGVYTAFVRDPFGNKLEVIHNGFAA
ncbi:MAG: VOC family protein [Parvularculaceae bacterium]